MPTASRSIVSSPRAGRARGRDPRGLRSERGAILVHVAAAFVGLLGFSALTIDLGILWVARAQAQTAADAAALSAAVSLAYVDSGDTGVAVAAADAIAARHQVWGEPANAAIEVAVGECPPGSPAAPGDCASAIVRRGAGGGTLLPALFGRLLGVNTQAVRASASAKVTRGNATECLRPWAVADRWTDLNDAPDDGVWTGDDAFERYASIGGVPSATLLTPADVYTPPSDSGSGTGHDQDSLFSGVTVDLRREPDLRLPLTGDLLVTLYLDRADSPGGDPIDNYISNVSSCNGISLGIGAQVTTGYTHATNTSAGVDALIAQDDGAYWDGTSVQGSAFLISPRIVPIALFDPDEFMMQDRTADDGAGSISVRVRNIVGFFVVEMVGESVRGVFMPMPGQWDPGSTNLVEPSSFLRNVALVR